MFIKKKKKEIYNEVGEILLDYEDFLIREKDLLLYNKVLKEYRNKFEMAHDSNRMLNVLDFGIYACAMSEIFNFYNNDICMDVAKICVMSEGDSNYSIRVIANFMDTVSVKMCSCWEYVFQILNQYFMLDLNSMALNRDILEKMYEKKITFVEKDGVYQAEYVEWTDEERKEVEESLNVKKRVLYIGKHAKGFKKEIKKQGYFLSERVKQISILYSSEAVTNLKSRVRNTITHKKSSTFAIAIGDLDVIIPVEGISVEKQGWIKIEEFKPLIIENLNILKKAIQIVYDIICLGEKLTHLGNENKVYKIVDLECSGCHKHMNLTSELYRIEKENQVVIKCPICKAQMIFIGEGETSEFEHTQVFFREVEGYLGERAKEL